MYKIGLDIGTTSVGYAILSCDSKGNANRIIDLGVRIFDAAENSQDGSSLALPRREARGARRRNRRHRHRLERIKSLLQNENIISKTQLLELYNKKNLSDIYKIRYEALERKLSKAEFSRLLIHYAQRRGFKSNRKTEAKNSDEGKLLKATSENKKYLIDKNYRTIGEMLYKDKRFSEAKRNKGGDYSNTFLREDIVKEIKLVFKTQKELNNDFITENLEDKYLNILESQRAFDEGPACGPYAGNQIEKMIGKCTFEPSEFRAAKATYSFEYFNLLQKINSLAIVTPKGKRFLTDSERKELINLAHTTENLKYSRIRKLLNLTDDELFNSLTYGDKSVDDVEKATFKYLPAYHQMRKAFNKVNKNYIGSLSIDKRNAIGTALTYYKTDNKIIEKLSEYNFTQKELNVIKEIKSFSKVGNLSIKAINKITPFLEKGLLYDKACKEAGYDFKSHKCNKTKYLPKLPNDCYDITSPVVKRAVNQTIKVVNAIIKKYGSPCTVNVELARELSKNFDDRKKIEKEQKENQVYNEKLVEEIKELGVAIPSGQDIVKYKLWKEQQGVCLYTNTSLKINRLFEPGYCEVDHIIPYSISFNDSYKNKVLVTAQANREKGNKIPMQYVKHKNEYIALVNGLINDRVKKQNLLKEELSENYIKELKERSLQDTKFISRFMLNYINDNLLFDENYEKNKRVVAVNGTITWYMRKRWGINKIRSNGDIHHAIDAVVVACLSDGVIRKVTNYSKYKETKFWEDYDYNKEFKESNKFPLPWSNFRTELDIRTCKDPTKMILSCNLPNYQDVDITKIKPVFVSRMVRKKQTGQAHKETIRSYKEIDGKWLTVTKTSLQNLKYDKKKDEITGYYNPSSDILLYNLLLEKLRNENGNAKKAFPEGYVLKPSPKGGNNPKVKKVKIIDKSTLNVKVNKGVAANGDMVRVDLYNVEGDGYCFVPIYVSDLIADKLPKKAVTRGKNKEYKNWKVMNDDDFIFSIYPNDLIKVTSKKDMVFSKSRIEANIPDKYTTKQEYVYYKSAGISTGSFTVINHDNSYILKSLGVKTLLSIEKCYVDILGNIYKAGTEKRK